MKKLYLLLVLLISGGIVMAQTCPTTISTFPYFQNFEASSGGWVASGTNSSWALGTPAGTVINSAASGTKAWVTNLTGNYTPDENSRVLSPCFNFTSVTLPIIEMKIWWDSESGYDGTVLQSSIDGGTTWQIVGALNDPNNWFNENGLFALPGGQGIGWSGSGTSSSGGWVTAKHVLTGLGNRPLVLLRIAFAADDIVEYEGFGFDDVRIYDTPANDAGITAVISPTTPVTPGVSQPVQVTVKNYGTAALTTATLGFSVNGTVVANNVPFTGNLALNQSSAPVSIGNYTFPTGNYVLKAWTRSPNGALDGNDGNDTLAVNIISCFALTGNYTIDKRIPASATNFISLTDAANRINSCGISAPVTFNVAAGSGPYNEQIILNQIPGATATNTITFNGNGNTITATPSGTNLGVITLDGTDFVKFDNFTLTLNAAATTGWGVQLKNDANSNTITNSTINLPLTSTSSNINGIVFGTTATTAANNGNNNTFSNNTINGGYYAFRINGPTGATGAVGNQIINNTIRDNYIYNIYLSNTEGTLIERNTISRPTRATVSTFYGVFMTGTSKNNIISKNRFHDAFGGVAASTGTAYVIYHSSTDAPTGSENIVKNNLIYNINTNGTIYAIYNAGSDGVHYLHNTIELNHPTSTGTVRGVYQTTAATNLKFQNNIFVIGQGASGTKHVLYYNTTTSTITSNNNVLYAIGTANVGSWGTANQATLAAWRTASSKDANSVSADPQFVNTATGNYQPTNSTVNNIGAPVGVTDDFTGAVRSTTTPDPGAYEFTPAANDAGITAIITPTSPVTPGVSQPVQVTIKNYGLSALTSATITWTVNSVAQTPFSWTGNLANNATANVTIGNYSFPAGNFTLNVCTSLPNGATDANPGNDCTQLAIISCNALAGTYTIDKNNPATATNFQSFTAAANTIGNCGISAPVIFNVVTGSGPYNEQIILNQIPGATAANTITFNGNGNTVSVAPGTTNLGIITLNGADFVKFDNFVLSLDATATQGWGVQVMNDANNNTITNSTINLPLTSTSSNINGIVFGATATTSDNNGNNNTFSNNTINGGYYSFRINGPTGTVGAVGNQIINNSIRDNYIYNIYLSNAEGTLIEGNTISRPTRTSVSTFYGVFLTGTSKNVTISKNQFHNTHGAATSLTGTVYVIYHSSTDAPSGAENIVKNNLIYNINTNGLIYAIYNAGSDGVHYLHNTIELINATNTGTVRGVYQTTAATNLKFQNNIFVIGQGASGTKHALYYGTTTSTITSDNNVLYTIGTASVGSWGTVNQTTLAAWRTASSKDANSVSADPQFVDLAAGNLRPTSVALNNIGAPVGVTDDITGAVRSATTPDPGAYEFNVNPNDVGVTAITGIASGCGLTGTQTVTITVKNFGSASQSNVPVSYTLSGTATGSGTGTVPGPIAPNATATFSFTTKANLAAPGPYTLVATTTLSGDADAANDSFTLNVANSLIPNLPIKLDFESPASGIAAVQVVTNSKSTIVEAAGASNGASSTKGMIMAGITATNWVVPVGVIDPWTNNGDQFSAIKMCISPASGPALDSLFLIFDLKQLFKVAAANTNFRVTVNGTQVGPTYNPPFSGTPIVWKTIRVDLTPYKNLSNVEIALESSVKEEYAGGAGTANLIDNMILSRRTTGLKADVLQSQISVFPNPSNGIFNVTAPKGNYSIEVTDMTGKTVLKQNAAGASSQLNLQKAAKGIYLLKITSEGSVATQRLVIQ